MNIECHSNYRVGGGSGGHHFCHMKNPDEISWPGIYSALNDRGYARIPACLSDDDCADLIRLYPQSIYRSVINMQRYRFGLGEYKYFSYPLPHMIQQLRQQFYAPLSIIANEWSLLLGKDRAYPENHSDFISICHRQNQSRPTPLILRYGSGGYNTLHQDLYGEVYFPFQVVFVLSQREIDYEGGALVITEQLPRAQSRASVIAPNRGDALIFTTNFRPVKGVRGYYQSRMKHGVSEITSGERFALGIIFHDAT